MSLQVVVPNWLQAIYNKALTINVSKLVMCLLIIIYFFPLSWNNQPKH